MNPFNWKRSQPTVEVPRPEVSACESPGPLKLDPTDLLDLLGAAGLVEVRGSLHADLVSVRPVAGLLSLPSTSTPVTGLRERLVATWPPSPLALAAARRAEGSG